MREILGMRRRTRSALPAAALVCAEQWQWPVVPGVGVRPLRLRDRWTAQAALGRRAPRTCACPRPGCPVPGAHPSDPPLLGATTDSRMVRWWWSRRPDAPLIVATGGAVSAVSLPAAAGARVLDYFDALRVPTGPVVASATRYALLVAPYSFEELGDLLLAQGPVPTSLRYHGPGGYLALPPSRTGHGTVHWERPPQPGGPGGAPWLPRVTDLVGALVAASAAAPDGSRLAY